MSERVTKDIQYIRNHWGDVSHDRQIRVRTKQELDKATRLYGIQERYEGCDGELLTPDNDIRREGGSE